jgi:uncharacterized membrane protein
MLVLIILSISLLIFRALGTVGISVFSTWVDCTRYALAVMFLFTSSAHFTKMRHDFARMMPKAIPNPMVMVYFTGCCEILGAIGILLPRTRSLAGLCLCIFLVCVLPANIKAARERLTIGGRAATELWLRVPMQVLFFVLVFWSTQPLRVFAPLSSI